MTNTLPADWCTRFAEALRGPAQSDEKLNEFADLLKGVDCSVPRFSSATPFLHPTMAHLEPLLAKAQGPEGIVQAARVISAHVNWYQIFAGGGIDPVLAQGMLAAQVAGQVGPYPSEALRAGLFLIAPGVHYPLHTHQADEVYYCVSGSIEIHHGRSRRLQRLTPGRLSRTPSDQLHSMTTGDEPVLMFYCWTGAVDAPNWWWAETGDGTWERARWERVADGSWTQVQTEAVADDLLASPLNL